MTRNWGLPAKNGPSAFRNAKEAKPLMTLCVTAVFGAVSVAIAAISFAEARDVLANLFHGASLVAAVIAAGFGCWGYVWIVRPRFAAHFTGQGNAFSSLLRFYARATVVLFLILIIGENIGSIAPKLFSVLILCVSGGAAAAAAFQTVLAFVPHYVE
jgi:hypothetical protein